MNVSNDISKQAQELGLKAVAQMDPLCEGHLRQLEHHPTDAEFQNTGIYNKFEQLVIEHAETQGYNWAELDVTVQTEFRMEVREEFDKGYCQPSDEIECIGCLSDGDIAMRVNNPDSITADSILNGKSRSGDVGQSEGLDEWR